MNTNYNAFTAIIYTTPSATTLFRISAPAEYAISFLGQVAERDGIVVAPANDGGVVAIGTNTNRRRVIGVKKNQNGSAEILISMSLIGSENFWTSLEVPLSKEQLALAARWNAEDERVEEGKELLHWEEDWTRFGSDVRSGAARPTRKELAQLMGWDGAFGRLEEEITELVASAFKPNDPQFAEDFLRYRLWVRLNELNPAVGARKDLDAYLGEMSASRYGWIEPVPPERRQLKEELAANLARPRTTSPKAPKAPEA